MLCIGNGCESNPELWTLLVLDLNLDFAADILPCYIMYRINNTFCKAQFVVLKLYLQSLRATAGKEGMLNFSCRPQGVPGDWTAGTDGVCTYCMWKPQYHLLRPEKSVNALLPGQHIPS